MRPQPDGYNGPGGSVCEPLGVAGSSVSTLIVQTSAGTSARSCSSSVFLLAIVFLSAGPVGLLGTRYLDEDEQTVDNLIDALYGWVVSAPTWPRTPSLSRVPRRCP